MRQSNIRRSSILKGNVIFVINFQPWISKNLTTTRLKAALKELNWNAINAVVSFKLSCRKK